MSERFHFIWGPGGVGKSHMAIRRCYQLSGRKKLLMTLDPSRRLYPLLHAQETSRAQEITFGDSSFYLKQTDAMALFEELQKRAPANERIQRYFKQLVEGLQRFRDYLSLIELADEMRKSQYDSVVVDTPPFQEAKEFQRSITHLRSFFDQTLVQLTVRKGWLQMGVRKVIELCRSFVGNRVMEDTLAFLDWMNNHLDRLQAAATHLEKLLFSIETKHSIVLTPESSLAELRKLRDFFGRTENLHIVINRSVAHLSLPDRSQFEKNAFYREFFEMRDQEEHLVTELQQVFGSFSMERIPLMLMGDDTREELLTFIRTPSL